MDRKLTLSVIGFFVAVLALGLTWGDILEKANPTPPKLEEVLLVPNQTIAGEEEGTYIIQDNIISSCAVAYTYSTPDLGKVEVYEIDGGIYSLLNGSSSGGGSQGECFNDLLPGTLKVRFNQRLESLSVAVWVGKVSEDGEHVYFKLIGTWEFYDNVSAVYIQPSPEKDFKLLTRSEVKALVEENGIHKLVNSPSGGG